MRFRLNRKRATATAAAAAIAVVGLVSTGCTAQTPATKVVSGTIQGADGKIVDVLVGFDVRDGAGRRLDLGGGTGYSAMQRLNHCVPTTGATKSQVCKFNGVATQVTGKNWSIRVPSNAATMWIEVYPKAPTPTAWLNNYRGYTGVAAGSTDTSTYSTSMRRQLNIGGGMSNVKIVLPKSCRSATGGGTTGSLIGHINGWPGGQSGKINAWSLASANLPDQGFATGTVDGNGNYHINGLQSGQRYGVIAGTATRSWNLVDYRRATSNDTLIDHACQQKVFNF
jgi:hypothetical protein